MVNQPQHPAPAANPAAPGPVAPATPAYSSVPGGMASDPVAALANEIATNIRGMPDRLRGRIDSTPALKAVYDNEYENLNAEIAQSIRRLVDAEVAKVTGGVVPGKAEAAAERERIESKR